MGGLIITRKCVCYPKYKPHVDLIINSQIIWSTCFHDNKDHLSFKLMHGLNHIKQKEDIEAWQMEIIENAS